LGLGATLSHAEMRNIKTQVLGDKITRQIEKTRKNGTENGHRRNKHVEVSDEDEDSKTKSIDKSFKQKEEVIQTQNAFTGSLNIWLFVPFLVETAKGRRGKKKKKEEKDQKTFLDIILKLLISRCHRKMLRGFASIARLRM
jgi:hypothetical protein